MDQIENYKVLLGEFYRDERRMPSYAEAAKLFGVKSKDTAFKIIQKMIVLGIVAKDQAGKIIPKSLESETVKLLGLIEAGFPTPAEEDVLDTVSLDDWLIKKKDASFMLRVKGDSMIEAGIREGDMVIVERTHHAKVGQIVIAEVDGAWTMKYLEKDSKGFYLRPANQSYKNIRPADDLRISAVVRAVIRKYD